MDPKLIAFLESILGWLPPDVQMIAKDLIAAGPAGVDAFQSVKAAVAKFPPRSVRTIVSIVEAFGVPADSPVHKVAVLADMIEKDVEEFQAAHPATPEPVPVIAG